MSSLLQCPRLVIYHLCVFLRLGISRIASGLQMKYSIPRSLLQRFRSALQAVSSITSTNSTSQVSASVLGSSVLPDQPPRTPIASRLSTSRLSLSNMPAPIQQSPTTRSDELQKYRLDQLRELCQQYGIKKSGKKQELITRIIQAEQAVKQGLTAREELSRFPPVSSRLSSLHGLPATRQNGVVNNSHLNGNGLLSRRSRSHHDQDGDENNDESLLHQLRREDYERLHPGQAYYRNADGQYDISLDDTYSFDSGENSRLNSAQVTVVSPSFSRVQPSMDPPSRLQDGEEMIVGDVNRGEAEQRLAPTTPNVRRAVSLDSPVTSYSSEQYTVHRDPSCEINRGEGVIEERGAMMAMSRNSIQYSQHSQYSQTSATPFTPLRSTTSYTSSSPSYASASTSTSANTTPSISRIGRGLSVNVPALSPVQPAVQDTPIQSRLHPHSSSQSLLSPVQPTSPYRHTTTTTMNLFPNQESQDSRENQENQENRQQNQTDVLNTSLISSLLEEEEDRRISTAPSFHHEMIESSFLSSEPSLLVDRPLGRMIKEEQQKKWIRRRQSILQGRLLKRIVNDND